MFGDPPHDDPHQKGVKSYECFNREIIKNRIRQKHQQRRRAEYQSAMREARDSAASVGGGVSNTLYHEEHGSCGPSISCSETNEEQDPASMTDRPPSGRLSREEWNEVLDNVVPPHDLMNCPQLEAYLYALEEEIRNEAICDCFENAYNMPWEEYYTYWNNA